MSKVLTDNKYYSQIADAIREQNGTNNTYTPPQMVRALKDLFYEEVEGVPPISFNGIGENLLDYKIDGARGGVGDRTDNLFDGILLDGYYTDNTLTTLTNSTGIYKSLKANLPAGTYTVVYSEAVLIIRYIELNGVYMPNPAGKGAVESYTFTLNSNSTISLGFRNSTNTQWDDSIKIQVVTGSIVPSKYEPYGYKVPVVVNGKNLLDEANAVVTDYYLTNDGQETVGANGDQFLKSYINVNPSTEYTFKWSQTIMGYFNNTPYIRITEYTSNKTFIKRVLCQCSAQSQNNYTFTTSNNTVYIDIRIDSETSKRGQHITEVMLVKGATAPDTYEEYTATTTNIYLDEPIEENESISLSDTNVNIPTIKGTNVLTVDTTVQPSNVYVKARKESQYETIMRENYEQELSDIESALQEV